MSSVAVGRGSDRPHRLALGDAVANRDGDRAQSRQRDRPTIRSPQRDRLPVGRERPGKGHDAVLDRADIRALGAGDVDSTVA